MGLHGISITSLVLIFLIVLLLFGSKRIRTIGEDFGRALKGFRHSMKDSDISSKDETPKD